MGLFRYMADISIITTLILAYKHLKAQRFAIFVIFAVVLIDPFLCAITYLFLSIIKTDLEDMTINSIDIIYLSIILFSYRGFLFDLSDILIAFSLFYALYHKLIGDGDVYILIICSLSMSLYDLIRLLTIASSSAMIYLTIKKRTIVPFGPFIMLGLLYVLLS